MVQSLGTGTHLDLPLNDGDAMRRGHDMSNVNVRVADYEKGKKETPRINYYQWLSTGYPNMKLEEVGEIGVDDFNDMTPTQLRPNRLSKESTYLVQL